MPQDLNQMTNDSMNSMKDTTNSMRNVSQKAGRVVKKATSGLRRKAKEGAKKAAKAAAKRIAQALKSLASMLAKLIAAAPAVVAVVLVIAIFLGMVYVWYYEDRGTSKRKTLFADAENPSYIDEETGSLTSTQLTEPQAILDAYYKYMSCQSYIKEYGYMTDAGTWESRNLTFRHNTEDFAGLSDYYGAEGDYYLSPELIMMADEILHQDEFRWPEHIITPVNHKLVSYVDADGNDRMVVETQPLVTDGYVDKELIKQSGLGSVLQYQPGVKDDYVSAKITKFQVDFDLVIPPHDDETETHYQHLETKTFTVSDTDTASSLRHAIDSHRSHLNAPYIMSDEYVVYHGPSDKLLGQFTGNESIERVANGVTTHFTIDHMPQEVLGRDMEVDKTAFNDSTVNKAFGNDANGLYPINIPLISSVATFSGNVRYTYISEPNSVALQDGGSDNLYDPVSRYTYEVTCHTYGKRELTANKTGNRITVCPVVASKSPDPRNLEYTREQRDIDSGNPWDYEYFDTYVDNYSADVPNSVLEDADFYKRATDDDTIAMLKELGLLSDATGALDAVGEYSEEDLMIIAKVIKHEAGSNKLDELMVGAVFVNRMSHPSFPNTAYEVLMQPKQYGAKADGSPGILWDNIIPSESNLDSARRVLTGEFSIPSNVVFQAAFTQGQGTYLTNVNSATGGAHENTHYYCWYGSALSSVDRFGRTALASAGAIALAKDIEEGTASASEEGSSSIVHSGDKLYASVGFNVVTGTNMLHKIAKPKQGFLGTFAGLFETAEDFFSSMTDRFFADNFELDSDDSFQYSYRPHEDDQRRIIYQAVTFRDSERYSDVASNWKDRKGQFLFIGDKTDYSEISIISYVGSILPNWVSPTAIPSTPISTTAGTSGKGAVMSTLEGELLQSLYNGKVTAVTTSSVTITYDAVNGTTYRSTYHGLSEVFVTLGTQLKTGDSVGEAGSYEGAPGFMFEFYCVTTASYELPMSYFYQVVYSGGGSDIVSVALAEAAAYKANPAGFDKLKYERWRSGSSVGEAWCADFVSWCGWQVYPNSAWPKTAATGTMKQLAEAKGVFEPSAAHGGSYIPQPGDVIFYIWDNSNALICSHVGLVVGVEGSNVITVEGNTSKPSYEPVLVSGNGVWRKSYNLSHHEIIGYGRFSALITAPTE